MRCSRWLVGLLAGVILGASSPALAADGYPLPYGARPLTLPRGWVAPWLTLEAGRTSLGGSQPDRRAPPAGGIQLGVAAGVADDFEIGALLVPIQLVGASWNKPGSGSYGSSQDETANPALFATYRFLATRSVELGVRLQVYAVMPSGAGVRITPSLPARFHFGRVGRLDLAVAVPITARGMPNYSSLIDSLYPSPVDGTELGLFIPISMAFDVLPSLRLGLRQAFQLGNLLRSRPETTISAPLGFFVGYAFGKNPLVDLEAYVSSPFLAYGEYLLVPTPDFRVGLTGTIHFDVGSRR